jgi:hypothetical protein
MLGSIIAPPSAASGQALRGLDSSFAIGCQGQGSILSIVIVLTTREAVSPDEPSI